jgi:hypothetical protein
MTWSADASQRTGVVPVAAGLGWPESLGRPSGALGWPRGPGPADLGQTPGDDQQPDQQLDDQLDQQVDRTTDEGTAP